MATRLPRCFAAAAAAAAASSASGNSNSSSSTPPTKTATSSREQAGDQSGRESWRREAAAAAAAAHKTSAGDGGTWRGAAGRGAVPLSARGEPPINALRSSLQDIISSVRLVRVAHADAAAVAGAGEAGGGEGEGGDGDSGMLSPLEDGDKPEYIQRADEQVRCSVHVPCTPYCLQFRHLWQFGVRTARFRAR